MLHSVKRYKTYSASILGVEVNGIGGTLMNRLNRLSSLSICTSMTYGHDIYVKRLYLQISFIVFEMIEMWIEMHVILQKANVVIALEIC